MDINALRNILLAHIFERSKKKYTGVYALFNSHSLIFLNISYIYLFIM